MTTLEELKKISKKRKKILFYPSCGNRSHKKIFQLNYDVFIFSDYSPENKEERQRYWRAFSHDIPNITLNKSTTRSRIFSIDGKKGYLFFKDNNEVLEIIRNSGNKIHCFVGVNDGCCEGGNYECVNDLSFLAKTLSLMPDKGQTYITDHSKIIFFSPGHGSFFEPYDKAEINNYKFIIQDNVSNLVHPSLSKQTVEYKIIKSTSAENEI